MNDQLLKLREELMAQHEEHLELVNAQLRKSREVLKLVDAILAQSGHAANTGKDGS